MSVLTITKESYGIFFKNIHWFALFLLPLHILLSLMGPSLAKVSIAGPVTLLHLTSIIVTIIVVLIGLVMLERMRHKEALVVGAVASHAGRRLLPLIGMNFVRFVVLIIFGFIIGLTHNTFLQTPAWILSILAALFLMIKYALAQTLIVTENRGVLEAFYRSAELMKGKMLPMLALLVLLLVTFGIFGFALYKILMLVAQSNPVLIVGNLQLIIAFIQLLIVLLSQLALIHIYNFYQECIPFDNDANAEDKVGL